MDYALHAALLGGVMGSGVLAASTIYGWTLPRAPRAFRWWAAAFVLALLSEVVLLGDASRLLVELSDLLEACSALALAGGALRLLERRIPPLAAAAGLLAGLGWVPVARSVRDILDLDAVPLHGIGGVGLLLAAWALAATGRRGRLGGHRAAALAFGIAGLLQLAAPLLHTHSALASWSLLLGQLTAIAQAVTLLLLVLRRHQARAESADELAAMFQRRFVEALGNVQDGIALYDAQDRLVTCNDRYRAFLQPTSAMVVPGVPFETVLRAALELRLFPEAIGREEAWLQETLTDHRTARPGPRERQMADGRWVAVSVYQTADGGHLRILRDITVRKQAQAGLEETVSWLRGVMDTVVDGIITIDETGAILSANAAVCRIFGYQEHELVGRSVGLLTAGVDRHQHDSFVAHYQATGQSSIIGQGREVQGARKDGSVFPLDLTVTEMRTKDGLIFIGVLRDITERKQHEQTLADHATRLTAILDNMAQGVAVFDGRERLVAINGKARLLLDLPEETIQTGDTTFLGFLLHLAMQGEFGPGDPSESVQKRLTVMRRNPALVFEHARPNGMVLEVRSTLMPGGGFIQTYTDITERKHSEDALREAKDAAERGNRAKTIFLANMSHELRTPLNAIIGFSEMIQAEIFGAIQPASYRSYVDDIHESGQHLLELINDILDMSKAEAGMTDLAEVLVDVGAVIATAVRMMAKRSASQSVVLTAHLADGLPLLRGDERRIRQIVLNLLSNAVKFTEAHGQVSVTAETTAEGFVLRIADSGIGMSAEDMIRVMEPFVQADTRLSRKYEGTGLGLPLTKALVEAHGGSLRLDSAPGQGTTATVIFPPERIVTPAGR